jgi:hypothetical protein
MPITSRHDNSDDTITLYEFVGEWTDEDFYRVIDTIRQQLDSQSVQRMDAIFDMRQSTRSGRTINPLQLASYMRVNLPDRGGIGVLVASVPLWSGVRTLLNAIFSLTQQRVFMADTLDDARAIIHRHRARSHPPN